MSHRHYRSCVAHFQTRVRCAETSYPSGCSPRNPPGQTETAVHRPVGPYGLGVRTLAGRARGNSVAESVCAGSNVCCCIGTGWASRAEARRAIFAWIDEYSRYLHSTRGYLSLIECGTGQQYRQSRLSSGPCRITRCPADGDNDSHFRSALRPRVRGASRSWWAATDYWSLFGR